MFFIMELEIPLDQSEKMLVKLIVSIVLRRGAVSLTTDTVELPREFLKLEKDPLSMRVEEGLWITLSWAKLALSIESAIDDSRLWTAFSGIIRPPVGGEVLGVRCGDVGGDRFDISIMAFVAWLFSSPFLSETGLSTLALSAVTTGSAA